MDQGKTALVERIPAEKKRFTITWCEFDERANKFSQVLRAKGRKKDVIITGGENVFPVEVENFLHTHPSVKDVAAIGVPDERLGELVALVIDIIPGKKLTEKEVFEHCEKLPRYKRLRKVFFGEVPRSPTGKIEKPKLRKRYTGMAEAFKI